MARSSNIAVTRPRKLFWNWRSCCVSSRLAISSDDWIITRRVSHSRLFAKKKYAVALLARGEDSINKLASEINQSGGQVCPFNHSYTYVFLLHRS